MHKMISMKKLVVSLVALFAVRIFAGNDQGIIKLQGYLPWYDYTKMITDCGRVTQNLEPLIVDGVEEKFGNSPWHVAMYKKTPKSEDLICGGTLISAHVVISAAHCFYNSKKSSLHDSILFKVVVAKFHRDYNATDSKYQRSFQVEEIRIPSEYRDKGTNFAFDVALLSLTEKVQFSTIVLPACIELGEIDFEISEGTPGKLSGWGSDSSGELSEVLLTANLTFSSFATCISRYDVEDRPSVTMDKICGSSGAGGMVNHPNRPRFGPSARQGDSGGGYLFLHPSTGRYYLRGVVSARILTKVSATLFTNVIFHKQWIERNLMEIENGKLKKELHCPLPKREDYHGKISVTCNNSTFYSNNEMIPDSCDVTIECSDGNNSTSACVNGTWIPEIPLSCLGGCPMMSERNVQYQCSKRNETIPCGAKLTNNTLVRLSCNEYYHFKSLAFYEEIICLNGKLSREPPLCETDVNQICGRIDARHKIDKDAYGVISEHWPWLVSFINNTEPICLGALIAEEWVLTTGKCAKEIKAQKIKLAHLGELHLLDDYDGVSPVDVPINRTYIYPKYGIVDEHDNVALVRLQVPVAFTSTILPVCLMEEDTTGSIEEGILLDYDETYGILYEMQARILDIQNCYKVHNLSNTYAKSELCTNSTEGVSGSPLFAQNQTIGIYYLLGLQTYDISCTTTCKYHTMFFSKSVYYNDWITSIIEETNNEKSCPHSLNTTTKDVNLQSPPQCGKLQRSNEIGSEYQIAKEHWPWLVTFDGCYGTLIYNDWILTNQYCAIKLNNSETKLAHLGDLHLNDECDGVKPLDVPIDRIISHPKHGVADYYGIALLHLQTPIIPSESIFPICLPTAEEREEMEEMEDSDEKLEIVLDYNQQNGMLLEMQAKLLDSHCFNMYNLTEEHIRHKYCTNLCQGEFGGPLIFQNKATNVYYLIGVYLDFKYLIDACEHVNTFYIKVSLFDDWIAETIKSSMKTDNDLCKNGDEKSCSRVTSTTKKNMVFRPSWQCGKSVRPIKVQSEPLPLLKPWPWIVSFLKETHISCIGSLISDKWVLTSGSCAKTITDSNKIIAHLGELPQNIEFTNFFEKFVHSRESDTNKAHEEDNSIEISIDKIIIHPEYNHTRYHNIALVSFKAPVKISESIQPVCLPNSMNQVLDEQVWGKRGIIIMHNANDLLLQTQTVMDIQSCIKSKAYNHTEISIENGLCSECYQGNSGSPLMLKNKVSNTYYLSGIASNYASTIKGCEEQKMSYTKIEYFIEWIAEVIGN